MLTSFRKNMDSPALAGCVVSLWSYSEMGKQAAESRDSSHQKEPSGGQALVFGSQHSETTHSMTLLPERSNSVYYLNLNALNILPK